MRKLTFVESSLTLVTAAFLFSFAVVALAQTEGAPPPPPADSTTSSRGEPPPPPPPPPPTEAGRPPESGSGGTSPSPSFQSMPPRESFPPPPTNSDYPKGGEVGQGHPEPQRYEGRPPESFQGGYPDSGRGYEPPRPPMMDGSASQGGDYRANYQSGGGDPNQGGQGSGGEDMQRRFEEEQKSREANDERMEQERQKRDEQMVKRQAAQMARMLQQNVNSIQKRVAKLEKQGIALTRECKETMALFRDAAAKVKAATTQEELEDAQDVMQGMDDLNQCRQITERLLNTPRILKNAANTLKSLKKRKVDVSDAESILAGLTARWNALKSGSPTNDEVEAFFDETDNLGDVVAPLLKGKRSSMQGASVFQSGLLDTVLGWFGF